MDAFSDPKVEQVVLMKAAQMAGSEVLNNLVGYFIHTDPSPIMFLTPREQDSRTYAKIRLQPMFRDSPCFKGLVREPSSRDVDNTILSKSGPGWRLTLASAASVSALSGQPIRILICDEVDRYPTQLSEGDSVELAKARTITFSNRKVALVSTPTDEETSRIAKAYNESDRRVYLVPCCHCSELQTLKWAQVKWEKDAEGKALPATAAYFCEHCGAEWTEGERHQAVRLGHWKATAEFSGTAGFHLNALYAPWSNLSLPKLAEKWLNATSDGGKPQLLRTFVNTILGETFHQRYESVDTTGLAERCEVYPARDGVKVVPAGVAIICAGVDVQQDRLECSLIGFGRSEETWVIKHVVFAGSPAEPHVWNDLWEFLSEPIEVEKRGWEYVRVTCVDTGYQTQAAYDFCRPRFRYPTPDGRRGMVFAVKGQPGSGTDIWPRKPLRSKTAKIPVYGIRPDPAKEVIYARLQKVLEPGPGYVHFPDDLPADYFTQLTSERVVTKYDARGFPKRVWELKGQGKRNETLDCFVYALAGLASVEAAGFVLDRECERMDALLESEGLAGPEHPAPPAPGSPSPVPGSHPNPGSAVNKSRRTISRSNYLGR